MVFQDKRWIFIALAVVIFVLTACAAASEAEPSPTPVSSIEGLPLPTEGADEIVAVIVTPTSAAGEAEVPTAEPTAEESTETTPEATEAATKAATAEAEEATAEPTEEAMAEATAEPTGEAEAGATEPTGEATEGTAEPTAEATEQPAEGGEMAALSEEELINRGEEIYASQCAKCHQLNGRGMGEAFPALRGSEIVTTEDPSAVIDTVLHGPEAMPSFENVLSAQEIAAVVSYIRNAWDNNASAVDTQEVQEVQETGGAEGETAQNE